MRIAVVVGNLKPASRTLGVAIAVADAVAAEFGAGERLVVDLAEIPGVRASVRPGLAAVPRSRRAGAPPIASRAAVTPSPG